MCFSSCWLEPTSQFNGLQPEFLKLKKQREKKEQQQEEEEEQEEQEEETMTLGTHLTHRVEHKFTEKALGAVGGRGVWENPNFKQANSHCKQHDN